MATKNQKSTIEAARKIRNAWKHGKTIKPVRDALPKGNLDAAYAVQKINTDIWIKEGRRVIGRKIGLTAKAVQTQLGVDQPDYGIIYADMAVVDYQNGGCCRLAHEDNRIAATCFTGDCKVAACQ